jgi:hypothetical protein
MRIAPRRLYQPTKWSPILVIHIYSLQRRAQASGVRIALELNVEEPRLRFIVKPCQDLCTRNRALGSLFYFLIYFPRRAADYVP